MAGYVQETRGESLDATTVGKIVRKATRPPHAYNCQKITEANWVTLFDLARC